MKKLKSNPTKTALTISMGFLVIYLISGWKWAVITSLVIGLIGVFSPFLSRKVEFLWMKLTYFLGLIVPNILLGAIFYLFLFPIAILSKLFKKKDPLFLNNHHQSTYVMANRTYAKSSFEKPW
jgi:hypothetical protein